MIHPMAMDNIRDRLSRALNSCHIEESGPVFTSYVDHVSGLAKEVIKHKKDWLTTSNVYSIFSSHVRSALSQQFPKDNNIKGNLKGLLGDNATDQLLNEIVEYILSLPRTYLIYFPLPVLEGLGQQVIELSDNISIKTYLNQDDIPGRHETKSLLASLLSATYLEVAKSYICIEEIGYAGGSVDDSAFREALSKLKQLVHLGVACGVLAEEEPDRTNFDILMGEQYIKTINIRVFDQEQPDVIACQTSLPRSVSRHVIRIALNASNKSYVTAKASGEKTTIDYIKDRLKRPAKLLSTSPEDTDALPIKTAAEWAFEASATDNDTISFLQTCIGLEAILGDDSGDQALTSTLADRCAYLVGTNIKKRKEIKKDFKKLYKLRSKLVHGRIVRLDDDEKVYLDWGKRLLNHIILEEMKNFDIEKT